MNLASANVRLASQPKPNDVESIASGEAMARTAIDSIVRVGLSYQF